MTSLTADHCVRTVEFEAGTKVVELGLRPCGAH